MLDEAPHLVLFSNALKIIALSFTFISERELMFMFAICRRPSLCLSSVCRLSVTFVHNTQPIEIFGNVSEPFNTLVT